MSRLIFYSLVGLGGDALIIHGGLQQDWLEFLVGLLIAMGVVVMLYTGWWLRWENTVHPDRNGRAH